MTYHLEEKNQCKNHYCFKANGGWDWVGNSEKQIKFGCICKDLAVEEEGKMRSAAKKQRRRQRSLIIKESRKCRKWKSRKQTQKGRSGNSKTLKGQKHVNSKAKGQQTMNSKAKGQHNSKGKEQRKGRGQQKNNKWNKRERKCATLAKKRKGRYFGFANYGPGSMAGYIGYPHPIYKGSTFNYFLDSLITFSEKALSHYSEFVCRGDEMVLEPLWRVLWPEICN